MLKMVDGTGIIGVDMVCPLGGTVSPPQPPNYDNIEMEGAGSLMLPNSLKAPLERVELIGNSVQGENPAPDNPQEIKSVGRFDEASGKYLLDVKVTGKNLFDITKYDKYDDTWTNTTYTTKKLKLKPNTTYTMSCKRLVDKPKQYVFFLVEEGIASGRGIYVQVTPDLSVNYFISKGTFTTNDTGEITLSYYVDCPKEQYWFTEVIGDIQIEEGNKATPYEPYTEQTLTLTSDRPITKWDRLVEQGGQIGWLYGSKIYVVTGNEIFEYRSGYDQDAYTNRFIVINDLFVNILNDKQLVYCKILKRVQYIYAQNKLEEGIDTNVNQLHIKLSNDRIGVLSSDDTETRTAKIAEYIKNTYTDGIEILYATTDTVFLPLSESEQTQLRNLHSYNGTTHIFVDSGEVPCGIKLTYRKEK